MLNKNCPHYPCHKKEELEDCHFCYCPCYPCELEYTGGTWYYYEKDGSWAKVWDCSKCTTFHRKDNLKLALIAFKNHKKFTDLVKAVKKRGCLAINRSKKETK